MEMILNPFYSIYTKFRTLTSKIDPRIPVAVILFSYLVLGLTVLGFNRTPAQVIVTSASTLFFDALMSRLFKGKWVFGLSPLITSFSLSFLLNYSHDFALLFIPVFLSIGSKYFFQYKGKHFFNPALMGVTLSLLFSQELVTASPAYQWHGIGVMSLFILSMGLMFVLPAVNRQWLIGSFLLTFTLQTFLRALIMRHHLPFETLFLGTLSSPPFLIFTFFMITDPATSPKDKRNQIIVGISIALLDLALHLRQSYYTFFYAAAMVAGTRFIYFHLRDARQSGFGNYLKETFFKSGYYKKPIVLGVIAMSGMGVYGKFINPQLTLNNLNWKFEKIESSQSGLIGNTQGQIYDLIDPGVQHAAKWILSVGDSVSIGDVNNDGLPDVFLTNVLKQDSERAALFINRGNLKFERLPIPALNEVILDPKKHGLITNAVFIDYDNSGNQSLLLTVAFGHPILLKNRVDSAGIPHFTDVSKEAGLDGLFTNSISATFADFNKDGLLDLYILNVWPEYLPNYESPKHLNLFDLPAPEYAGDQRRYDFMHDSWHLSNNGGKNLLLLQNPQGQFTLQDSDALGMPETRWSLAVGVADLNQDQWPDIYVANDFGPDDLYYNKEGKGFEIIQGTIFGSIGKDTYKGMNVSIADYDRTGWQGVYVSNVHHAFQAEGSLLWMFGPGSTAYRPTIEEKASFKGVLNEDRFGWGGVAADFDNSGWVDIAQANGMVDDTWDKKFEECPDYWYVNEKVARSPPSIHRFVNNWGDLRGYCIYGKEQNRVYANLGAGKKPQFVDIATQTGVTELTNSRGVAAVDFDNRGRMDLIFTHPFAEPTLYKNTYAGTAEATPAWVKIKLVSLNPRCNREAVGTVVKLSVKNQDGKEFQISQEQQVVSGFAAQADKRMHFGLGTDTKSVSATIDWCYGVHTQSIENLEINKIHQIVLE